jgi:hypothetical protein
LKMVPRRTAAGIQHIVLVLSTKWILHIRVAYSVK